MSSTNVLSDYHQCIGTYEDKPTNCVYYFVSYDGPQRPYDSILEYNLNTDSVTTVYQDGRMNSDGQATAVLNFSRGKLITGVNKIGDILYWTDDKNRPRKINVKLAKQNEYNINHGVRYYDFYYRHNYSVVFITPNDNHEFKEGDYIYTHANISETVPYNGYAKVTGVVRKMPSGITFNVTADSFNITSSSAISSNDLSVGEFIGVVHQNFPRYFRVSNISGTTITVEGNAPDFSNSSAEPLHILGVTPQKNMAGIITDCPWSGSGSMVDSNGASISGVLLHANPDDAYSPLISFGGYHDKSKYLDVIKHQPTLRPQSELGYDNSSGKNDILDNLFQFKYRYKHYDEELTSYSGVSDIKIDDEFSLNLPLTYDSYNDTANVINVEYFDTISDVKQVEVVARRGNTGEFVLIDTVENNFISYLKILKNELIPDPDYHFDVDSSIISFKNNGIYPFVDKADSDKLFDVVPKLAKAQTILSNNRIAYGNVVEGYDNTPVVANSSFKTEGNPAVSDNKINCFGYRHPNLNNQLSTSYFFDEGTGGNMNSAFDESGTHTYWNTSGSDRCEVATWIDLTPIASGLAENQNQSIYIEVGWKIVRDASTLSGGQMRKAAGFFNMTVDVTDSLTLSSVKGKISEQFNQPNFSGWSGGTITDNAAFADIVNIDGGGSEGEWNLDFWQGGNTMKIKSKTVKNSQMDHGAFDWADGNNEGWGNGGYTWYAKVYFVAGSPGFSSFKTGAFHDFGVSYFDETNRCSFVNVAPKYNDYNGSRPYNQFVTEPDGPALGQTSTALIELFNAPPPWATHYQIMYTGNTTVGDFMQITTATAKAGEDGDTQIYLGLHTLKGNKASYSEGTGSELDFDFQEKGGDRIRFISCENGGGRQRFNSYLDFKITGFDFYQDDGEELPITLDTGGAGFYIRIADPGSTGVDLENGAQVSIGHSGFSFATSGYNKLIAEVYREQKSTSEESMVYYEVGDKLEIIKPGGPSRRHSGTNQNQSPSYSFNEEAGVNVSDSPAIVEIKSGDIYLKPRQMFTSISTAAELLALENFSCEDVYLNDFHNTNHWSKGRVNIINNKSKERRLSATIYHSEAYSSTGATNGLSNFNPANSPYFDYNVDFGSIQSLKMRDNDLIIFHESKIGRVLVDKDILTTASAEGLVSLSNNIIANYVNTFSGDYGCGLHPESVVQHGQKFYFVDIKRGVALRLGGDGLTVISNYNMKDYFRDLGEMYTKYNPKSNMDEEGPYSSYGQILSNFNIIGGYDPKYDEYVVGFPELKIDSFSQSGQYVRPSTWDSDLLQWEGETQAYNVFDGDGEIAFHAVTLGFSEGQNRWTSFYSFIPEFCAKINRQFITFKKGRLYRHNDSDVYNRNRANKTSMNTFYGNRHLSYLDFIFNAEPSSVKTYNAIGLESDTKFLTGLFSNMGQYYGNYNDVISTSIAYKKVSGTVSAEDGDTSSRVLLGQETEFYKDVRPGDLVRIFGGTYSSQGAAGVNYIYKDFIVSKIESNECIVLNEKFNYNGVNLVPDNSLMYVIDYKTKEGIQYADIPFCSSGVSNDDSEVSFGDGSEITSIGRMLSASNIGGPGMGVINLEENVNRQLINDLSFIELRNAIVGGSYVFRGNGLDNPIDMSFSNVVGDAAQGVAFTCLSTPPDEDAEIVSTDLALYAKDIKGNTYFLGYPTPNFNSSNNSLSYLSTTSSYTQGAGGMLDIPSGSFVFAVKRGKVEGEKMKGSYLRTILATNNNQSTKKFNLYAANVDVDKSELSNR
tara:strand:- start:3437 stop:8707 length:5271 start_codon:yes stop_codon:yes gene_type:complete